MDSNTLIRVISCGSVDDGKSTLVGRLLAETGSVPDDQLEAARHTRRPGSTVLPGDIDYSLLTDGLDAEREQGITIDVAYRHLILPSGGRAIVADVPGHEQYTRNMAVAASTADAAVLVTDSTRGVQPQTLRHLTICALMGIDHIVIAINKMDVDGYDHTVFDEMSSHLAAAAARLDVTRAVIVPVSALAGDNVLRQSNATPWYAGPTVLSALDAARPSPPSGASLRIPVQTIARTSTVRAVLGTVASGVVTVGDTVAVAGRPDPATVVAMPSLSGDTRRASAGEATCLVLEPDIDVSRGDILIDPADDAIPADRFSADLIWTGETPLAHGRSYLLVCGPARVPATITSVRHRLNVETGEHAAARLLRLNDIGRVELATDSPILLDAYHTNRYTGGFVLVDRVSADTVAAGMVRYALRRSANITRHDYAVTRESRERLNGHRGRVIWLTGLSGAGKSTIADGVERALHAQGARTFVLDGDNVRTGLTKDLGFTPEDRAENVRRVAETARLMMMSGIVVIVALVSPFRVDRRNARALFGPEDFVEVFVDTPLETCRARDVKGLYAKAAGGELPNLSGVGQDYEPPTSPELRVCGDGDLDETVAAIVRLALDVAGT